MSQLPGFRRISLQGILHIEKDENGVAGLEIEDCLSINNLYEDQGKHLATGQNLLLECPDGELLQKDAPLYQLEDSGRTTEISIGERTTTVPVYLCKEFPNMEFSVIDRAITLINSHDEEISLSKDSMFQITIENESLVLKLGAIYNIHQNFRHGLSSALIGMYNCFNNIPSFDLEISSTIYSIIYCFNNIENPILIDLHQCTNMENYVGEPIATMVSTCFNGSTQGTVIFPLKVYDSLKSNGRIIPQEEESSVYVLVHNTNVIAQRGVNNEN